MHNTLNPHQSRWGFHPCDEALYRKLKLLRRWYYQTLHDHAAWRRWARKEPQNRVIREYQRDELGRKCGVQFVRPRPEPAYCSAFVNDGQPTDQGIVALFHRARRPQPHPVEPFTATETALVEKLLREAAAYFVLSERVGLRR
jgi:hypothetical protein